MKETESRIILTGEPKSTQHIYGLTCRGRFATRYMTPAGKALKEAYQWEAKAQWRGKPLEGDLSITIKLYFGTKRRANWDNFHKLSMDALSGIAWTHDSQITEARVMVGCDKQRPRIEGSIQ